MRTLHAGIILWLVWYGAASAQEELTDFANEIQAVARDTLGVDLAEPEILDPASADLPVGMDFPAGVPPVSFSLEKRKAEVGTVDLCAFPNSSLAAMFLRYRHKQSPVTPPPSMVCLAQSGDAILFSRENFQKTF